jgi:hypothetical protein
MAAGVDLFTLARFMGTSVAQLEETYLHVRGEAARLASEKLNRLANAEMTGRLP